MSSSHLPIKHPSLRPRIFDPFSRGDGGSTYIEDAPGAVAMCGPAARRTEDPPMLRDDGDDTFSPCDVEVERNLIVDTLDCPDVETQATLRENNEHEGWEDYDLHQSKKGLESKAEGYRRNCILGLVVVVSILGILAVVVALVLAGDQRTHNTQPSPSSPSNSIPTQNQSAPEDWMLVAEIVGSVDSFGFDVDFNEDGSLLAVAAPRAHNGRGQAQVFRRKQMQLPSSTTTRESEEWWRVGDPIIGKAEGDKASFGMDLSSDGSHLVVGYPGNEHGFVRVFRLDDENKWQQQGQTLAGPSLMSQFGSSVSISHDGAFLVVGAPFAGDQEHGMVQAYNWLPGSNWTEYGDAWYGDSAGDRFGSSVAMKDDGDVIVVGAPGDDTRWKDGGRVFFASFDSSSSSECSPSGCWRDVIGPDKPVTGDSGGNRLGQRLSMDPSSNRFVTSSVYEQRIISEHEHNRVGEGRIRLITVDQVGDSLKANDVGLYGVFGTKEREGFGYNVALDEGEGILFAATSLNNGTQTGVARVYDYGEDGRYLQQGSDIEALPLGAGVWEATDSKKHTGPSIAMVNPRVAIGYQSVVVGHEKEEVAGVVRVFDFRSEANLR
uniref:Uncharacterized protein n=1 Tax=Grammatophora oceanica TaxID=210454 RepID=A0A7S1YHH9_9STRA|mmetsp:Transcript_46948/g.69818  ORF Transcript_46948/g.69818 Transcript_46948/m.69818 type:complete len:604 (+) Transcript_46948:117-1928(+)|eukprot:CAMPEP_0194027600 /NCGR_PEP_ID=MMETSP0009_2-20130614/1738_1 /TAXON_ID=210454 /ORGANISM="Grammatophora oceanica, Strain CCMP 410" /LENGTH=603 /DNA_ID=CAMNT_0038666735 /DNA_START=99 /DNA_END=1910 /DNA_ORIENTATION=-